MRIIAFKPLYFVGFLLGALLLFACTRKSEQPQSDALTTVPFTPPSGPPVDTSRFAKGADVSWVTEMEQAGIRFFDTLGNRQELLPLLKSYGMNTVRLRVWVNPLNGWNSGADVLLKAQRARAQGMKLLINFHYSDSWADPGQQTKPAAWANMSLAALRSALRQHTVDVLTLLRNNAITPEWVQVGNETNDGLLWPDGRASLNMSAYAQLINSGYDAVKSVFPNAKVIVHLSNGWDSSLFRWNLDGLAANGARWDVIALSLYPGPANWPALNQQALQNMNNLVQRYNKEVMVVEVGMPWDQADACRAFLSDIISKTRQVSGGKGLGVLYWEPQAYGNWQGYTLGAFQNNGQPTRALQAFR